MQQSAHAASLLACASAVVLVISATFAKKEVVIGRPVFLADTVGRRARLQLLADETYKWSVSR